MNRVTIAIACAGLLGVGCASSAKIQEGARLHLERAQELEAHGDYYDASKERAAADKQFRKAQERAWRESYYQY
jgi:hypothetical protein